MSINLLDTPPPPLGEIPPGGAPSQPTLPTREELTRDDFKVWFLLLVIICLAALGSLPFIPPLSTLPARPATATPSAYTDGVCTATPADIQYTNGSSSAPSSSTLTIWSQTDKTQQDLNNVLACAASFTLKYEAYSADNLKSLEASIPMLSAAAKQRFYTPDPQSLINRMDPMWRANIQKQHLVRTAQVQQPAVVNVQTSKGRMLVWVTVPYILTIQTNGDTYPSNAVLTVLLVNTPTTSTIGTMGTGWQVSDWNDNRGVFQPPSPL